MQFHYVVGFDTDTQKWFVEFDTTAYFADGNVYNDSAATQTGRGWFYPGDDTPVEALLDQTLVNTLYSLVDVIPIPQEA